MTHVSGLYYVKRPPFVFWADRFCATSERERGRYRSAPPPPPHQPLLRAPYTPHAFAPATCAAMGNGKSKANDDLVLLEDDGTYSLDESLKFRR